MTMQENVGIGNPNTRELVEEEKDEDMVPAEATVFLGAVAVLLLLLLLAFLYMNKRICLHDLGGHCCEELLVKRSRCGVASALHDGEDSCSEADEHLVRKLQATAGLGQQTGRLRAPPGPPRLRSPPRSGSSPLQGGIGYERPSLFRQFSLQPIVAAAPERVTPKDQCLRPVRRPDLSLAERGKVGGGTSSSSSSTTSGEDDLTSTLRHRDVRRYRKLPGRTRSLDGSPQPPPEREDGAETRVATHEERLFDIDDLEGEGQRSLCGSLEVAFAYDYPTRKLTVQILQARDVPSRDRGGASSAQVRVVLLPGKKQRMRSRIQPGEKPQFNEAFVLNKVNPDDLPSMGVRLRLYGCERLRRERMIGEAIVPFTSANIEQQTPQWVRLQPRANMTLAVSGSSGDVSSLSRSDSTSSTQSIHQGGFPELLLALQYNSTTGRLAAEVVKGSQFRASCGSRAPDTYVRLHLLSCSGHEISRSKTSVRRGQPNPLYKETFMFQVPLFQLCDVTLMVSVYNKRNMKKRELIGWFALGHNSSGNEERSHWSDLRDARGVQICRWHVLCEE